MRVPVPHNDSLPLVSIILFTPKGQVTVTVDDSHHWVDIPLPEGVQEDEVDVYSCFLNPDHRPPFGCGPALLQAAKRQLADDTSAIADAASPLGGDPPASDDAAAPASPADDTSASAGDAATPAAPADTVAAVDETSVLADTAAPAAPTDNAPASAAATASPVPAASDDAAVPAGDPAAAADNATASAAAADDPSASDAPAAPPTPAALPDTAAVSAALTDQAAGAAPAAG